MDHQWIKNLAGASHADGIWKLANPGEALRVAKHQLIEALPAFYDEAVDAAAVFNTYCRSGRRVETMPLHEKGGTALRGFALMIRTCQVRLEHQGPGLVETLTGVKNYQRQYRVLRRFEPRFDPFGGLSWKTDQKETMYSGQIVKRLLTDLCHFSEVFENSPVEKG